MAKCKTCGRNIPEGLNYCSPECAEKDRNHTCATEKLFFTQFDKGHGSVRREQNIRRVKEMLERGIPEEEIRFQLSMLFRDMTVDSYIRTAKEWLKRESKLKG